MFLRFSVVPVTLMLGICMLITTPADAQGLARTSPKLQPSVGKGARIFIDKAHPLHSNLQEADFKKMADARLTIVARMWSTDLSGKPIDLGEYTRRAAKAGIGVMQWDPGLARATEADSDLRTMTRLGKSVPYLAPAHPAAWRQLRETLVGYAKLSKSNPTFKGALLDFEIYDENKTDGFCESYDDYSFKTFVKSIGREVPNPLPAPDQRKHFLENQQWYQMYVNWNVQQVAKHIRQIRRAIDVVNPKFQVGVYGWGVLVDPTIREFGTPQAPTLILDATTYSRSTWGSAFEGGYDANRPDKEALKWALDFTKLAIEGTHETYDNVIFLAGHYSSAPGPKDGTQYKFTAKQAFQSAAFGEGYWIWSDWITPEPWKDRGEWHDALVGYLGKANAAVDAKDWTWADREPETVPTPK